MGSAREFLDIAGKVVLECVEPPADVAPLLLGQRSHLLKRFVLDL